MMSASCHHLNFDSRLSMSLLTRLTLPSVVVRLGPQIFDRLNKPRLHIIG